MKHTPGPWRIEKDEKDEFVQYWVFGPNGRFDYPEMIVTRGVKESSQTTREQTEANIKLIAAAPAMYEALEWARVALKTNDNEYRQVAYSHVAAALALAEGRETVTT